MATFPNIRVNRVNAQTIASNFFQGTNADITNINCDNLAVSNFEFNDATFNGNVKINSTTQSTSTSTGALVVVGGVGIGKNLNVGGNVGVSGYTNIYDTTEANCSGTTGALTVAGGVSIGKKLHVGGTGCFDSDVYIGGHLGVTGTGEVYGNFRAWKYLSIGNSVGPGTSQLHLNYDTGYETGKNFQLVAADDTITIQHYLADTMTGETNFMSMSTKNSNTSLGYQALQQQPNNDYNNTAIGYMAGTTGNTGEYNVFVGSHAGTTGLVGTTGTICIGYQSGNYDTGNYNTFIGYQAGYTGTTYYGGTGLICIGANAYPSGSSASNECTIYVGGLVNTTSRFSNATGTWTASSDFRDKTDIEVINSGIDLINQIQPSKYRWDKREWYENGVPDGSKKNENWYSGFIAQQLDEVQTNNEAEYLNLVYKSNPDKLEIAQTNLIPVMVKALQDLSNENNQLKSRLEKLEEKIASLNL